MNYRENMALLSEKSLQTTYSSKTSLPETSSALTELKKRQGLLKNCFSLSALMKFFGVISIILLWQFLSLQLNDLILASPRQTVHYLITSLAEPDFWQVLLTSFIRLALALLMACFIGFSLGMVAGRKPWLRDFLAPIRWLLMSVPPVIVVLLAMLWFGLGSSMVIFITVLLLTPTIYINTQKNVEQIDPHWLELAQVYGFSIWQRFSRIYIPAIAAPLCATLVIVCCNGVRIVVLAEVLGAHKGIGFELANASSNFETAQLYSWVLVSLLIVALLELLLLKPIQNYLLRWRSCT